MIHSASLLPSQLAGINASPKQAANVALQPGFESNQGSDKGTSHVASAHAALSHLATAPFALSPADFSHLFNAQSGAASSAAIGQSQSASASYNRTSLLGTTNLELYA